MNPADLPEPGGALDAVTATTLGHYEANAEDYAARTRDHDVGQNIATLLRHLEGPRPWTILDLGCGPGRDLARIAAAGHVAVGLDGTSAFVEQARKATGATVLHPNFLALDLPPEGFDGIFANASLQHVPRRALPEVLGRLHGCLRPRGVLFASIPRGGGEEGWNGARFSVRHDLPGWRAFLVAAGFDELEHYYRPSGLPFEAQPWLASAWRKA